MTPYDTSPENAFWRLAVADRDLFDIQGLWRPKFLIKPETPVATYGSCFAQNIGRHLRSRGFTWLRTERPPIGLSEESAARFYYDVFSSRTGNIYTTSMFRQWLSWAAQERPVPEEVWEEEGRFFDPFRPVVEPDGFVSREEVLASRDHTVAAFRRSLEEAELLVFTLGQTENWYDKLTGYEFPICPGVKVGRFDPERHIFRNHRFDAVKEDLLAAVGLIRKINPELRMLLTVSPVPTTATQSGEHVVVASMQAKSILRAVAADMAHDFDHIDYFPSYELISSTAFRGVFFAANQRTISRQGIAFVMDQFAAGMDLSALPDAPDHSTVTHDEAKPAHTRDRCEEELLDAFKAHR
jgi:hypothetical protein